MSGNDMKTRFLISALAMKIKIHTALLSGRKYLLFPAWKMIAAPVLFLVLGATAMAAPSISMASISYNTVNPTNILVTSTGEKFSLPDATNVANWTFDLDTTGLELYCIRPSTTNKVYLNFIGTAGSAGGMGPMIITALAAAMTNSSTLELTTYIAMIDQSVTFTPITLQRLNTTNNLSSYASAPGTGTWTFTEETHGDIGEIVDETNLWMTKVGTINIMAAIAGCSNYYGATNYAYIRSPNNIPWSDNFESDGPFLYALNTPLIDSTNYSGWYSYPGVYDTNTGILETSTVQNAAGHVHWGAQAAKATVNDTLENSFDNTTNTRIVSVEMYIQPQLMDSDGYPKLSSVSSNAAAQFFVNSNGYFVVGNGTTWDTLTDAEPITNTYFTKVQVNLRYNNHTWNLKAWTNSDSVTTLVARSGYVSFTSNFNTFGGFGIYSGTATSYVDDVSVTIGRQTIINGVPLDTIYRINGAQPASINGVYE